MSERASMVLAMSAMALAACEPVETESTESPAPHAASSAVADLAEVPEDAAEDDPAAPRPMAQLSAWRVEGEDGSVYATFLDANGRYRDLKNGTLHQEGEWEIRGDGAICFLPEGDNVRGDCWDMEPPDEDGTVLATHSSGRRIELARIDYRPPDEE